MCVLHSLTGKKYWDSPEWKHKKTLQQNFHVLLLVDQQLPHRKNNQWHDSLFIILSNPLHGCNAKSSWMQLSWREHTVLFRCWLFWFLTFGFIKCMLTEVKFCCFCKVCVTISLCHAWFSHLGLVLPSLTDLTTWIIHSEPRTLAAWSSSSDAAMLQLVLVVFPDQRYSYMKVPGKGHRLFSSPATYAKMEKFQVFGGE